jgi:DNA-binding MltR family transcriptional regulator
MPKTLNEFLKDRPSGEEVDQLMHELDTDGPRGVAMIAAAIVDDVLLGAVKYRMVPLTEGEESELFGVDRPLSSFSSRIKLGYALGIFGKNTRHDLDNLRKIRNAFAHARRAISFETPEIAALCEAFHVVKDIIDYQDLEHKRLFVGVSKLLMFYLVTKIGPYPAGVSLPKTPSD